MTGFGGSQADLKTGVPVLVQQAVVDKVTGLTAAQAITAALFERSRTGRGQMIEIPMLHAGLAFLWPDVATNITMMGDFGGFPSQITNVPLDCDCGWTHRHDHGDHSAVGRAVASSGS